MENETKNYTIVEKLERMEGEVDFSKLSKEDLVLLLTRYFNDFATYLKNIVLFGAQTVETLTWLAESQGVDVKGKRQEQAKKYQEMLKKQEKELKEKLQNLK